MAKYPKELRPKPTPKKPDPWAQPESCKTGDQNEEITYAAVGRALTNWGAVEHQLGEIFLALIGGSPRSYEAMMAFGSIMSGRGRSDMIMAAAKAYFLTRKEKHHMETKKQLADLMLAVGGFADRRNEIAHGVVRVSLGPDWEDEGAFHASFTLTPSFFSAKKRTMQPIRGGYFAMPPTYEYSSKEINAIAVKFHRLAHPAATVARQLRRQRHLERQALSQKSSEPAEGQ